MADTTALKNRIRAAIKANDNQEITGPVLQQALLDMVDELNGATETEAKLSDIAKQVKNTRDEILEANTEYGNVSIPVDIVTGAKTDKYLSVNTAAVNDYARYNISAPIHLNKGDILTGTIVARDVCVLAETDSVGSSYTFIENAIAGGINNIQYTATNDMYIAVCYFVPSLDNSLSVVKVSSLADIALQVKNTRDEILEANSVVKVSSLAGIALQVKQNKQDIESIINSGTTVPSFVINEMRTTFERYQKWKGNDECLVFPILTDIHSGYSDGSKYKCIPYCIETDKLFGYNFIAHLGDLGLGNDNNPTEEKAMAILHRISEEFGKFKGRTFFAFGNHDNDFYSSLGIGVADVENYMAQPTFNRYNDELTINYSHQCFYKDYQKLNVRVIVTNTSDGNTTGGSEYAMTDEQLSWIYSTLQSVPAGYKVIILEHYCPVKIGEWLTYISNTDYALGATTQLIAYVKMLEAFANHTSVIYGNYSYDFTSLDNTIKLVGVFCGDSHFDAQLGKDESVQVWKKVNGENTQITISGNGVNWFITQGYGGVGTADIPSWATFTQFNKDEQLLIDVVAIKPKQNTFKVFRIGAGSSSRDREFTF